MCLYVGTFFYVQSLMDSNKFLLNLAKSEMLLFGIQPRLKKFEFIISAKLRDSVIPVSTSAQHLGVILDSALFFHLSYNDICKLAIYHFHGIYRYHIINFLNLH